MELTFEGRVQPPNAVPVQVIKDPTQDGDRSQVFVVMEFRDAQGNPLKDARNKVLRKRLLVSDGVIGKWVQDGYLSVPETYKPEEHLDENDQPMGWPQHKFKQLWDSIPDVDPAVLASLEDRIPVAAVEQLWEQMQQR